MFSPDLGVTPSSTLYAEDVFSTFLYTGNGGSLTINNGIDLAGKGGMVWIKDRAGATSHAVFNPNQHGRLTPDTNNSQDGTSVLSFTSSGFSFTGSNTASNNFLNTNTSGISYASWTFRKAPKFFNVVTFTGAFATINHNLGTTPAVVIMKNYDASGNWFVWHQSLGAPSSVTPYMWLDSVNAPTSSTWLSSVSSTSISFSATGTSSKVVYLFADDPSSTGLIRCGSFTTDASGNASVTSLGWEPQFLMVKASSTTGDWIMLDTMRGWNMTSGDALLRANLSNAETTSTEYGNPTATGFDFKGGSASATYVYMAIRRPNKPPTSASGIFSVGTSTYSGQFIIPGSYEMSAASSVDLAVLATRSGDASNFLFADRVRGFKSNTPSSSNSTPSLITSSTNAESATSGVYQRYGTGMEGYQDVVASQNATSASRVTYAFKRAPGFFDVVCYTGDGTNQMRAHNLGVTPELIIVKGRNLGYGWAVYYGTVNSHLRLDLPDVPSGASNVFYQAPTSTQFPAGLAYLTGQAYNYVAYLFASLPGISKIGTYTGNGTTQTINCGFAAGARFVLIKRTDAAGDWYVWDTARGIVAAEDPYLSLNSTAAEVTFKDNVDPVSSGFAVANDGSAEINVSSATYLYLAIA